MSLANTPHNPCDSCGASSLGIATDGRTYCHRIGCFDWKHERLKAQQQRDSRRRAAWLIPAPVEVSMPLELLLSDEDLYHAKDEVL